MAVKQYLPYYRHLKAVKGPFVVGVLCGLVYSAASGAGLPLMTKLVFPVLFGEASGGSAYEAWVHEKLGAISHDRLLLITCLWIPFIFLIRAVAGYTNTYLIQYSGLRVLEAIRTDLFVKLQSLPLSFFKKNRAGDLLARLMTDTEILRQVVAQASNDLIKQPGTLLFAVGTLVYLSIEDRSFFIALIAVISVPLCVGVIRSAGKRLAARARALQARSGDLTATLTESLQSSLEIRAYNLQERQISQFREHVRTLLRLSLKVVKYRQAISPAVEVVAATGFAVALYVGVRHQMSLNDFLTLGTALYMSYEPVKKLGTIHSLFRQGDAAVERMEFILHEPDTLPDPPSPVPIGRPREEIRFQNVSFAYGDETVLHDVNVTIPTGQVVALVGPSGAGKSTFASLIPRFYDPKAGAITIDGTDLRQVRKSDLRNHIAVVPQMPSLFSGSIAENIRIGRLDASDEEVADAARRAHADEFIRHMPQGYQTEVGERGDQLSGGQRQRIAIARAFLRDAPILILDEATSALDSESEAMVQQALAELVKGRTTFVIAHRFSTITIADRILVFQSGRIVADGSHEQLRESDPTYRSMVGGQLLHEGA
ncbi:MAG: ABC transporter ATP-binding protein [Akkermansiaceae bacterium]|nr:ABC transporter ATP-binding protein [Akkermansiaceae bacterium]MCP5543671.1 ABC transporter ATP-binding protein [Akkermansiaceae bacterium]